MTRTIVLLLIVCTAATLVPAQQPVPCSGPLSEANLTDLIKHHVAEERLNLIVRTCGVDFEWSDSVKSRLRDAGASAGLLEEIRARAPKKPAPPPPATAEQEYQDGKMHWEQKDWRNAIGPFQRASLLGDARAMDHLGEAYASGLGVLKDEQEAVRWFRKAAEAGNADGMHDLGVMYMYGRGVGKDGAEAVRWYRKAAEAGQPLGMNHLGWMFERGAGVGKDEAEAVRWYQKAADAGNALAMTNLGRAFERGAGVGKDEAEAVRWYQKAADAGDASAMTNMGYAFERGAGVGKDEAEAVRWYRKAAEAGQPLGMNHLGWMFERGAGVGKDEAEAVRWYQKAADAGNALAMTNLGRAFERGAGVSKDEAEAVRWYRKAADAGNASGMNNLGVMFEHGAGVGKDEAEAVRWYQKAADAGDAAAMINLGRAFERGAGVSKDEAEAVRWYRKAADAGNARGMDNLGVMYQYGRGVSKDEAEAVRWYRKAAEAGDPVAAMRVRATSGSAPAAGGGVTAPLAIYKPEPEYSEQARKAGLEGTVALALVVDVDGTAKNIRVTRSLGMGLDEKAIEAVQKWRFKPGQKDGQAVPTYANAEFQFRLGGKPGSDLAAGVGGGIGAGAVNLPLDDQTVLRSGTFHLSEEGNSDSATWGVVYGLKGRYTVRPREVLVTLEVGLAITPHPVKVSPVLHSLRFGVCYQLPTDQQIRMLQQPNAGQELLLNDVTLKYKENFRFPVTTIRIPIPTSTPEHNWLCSSLVQPDGRSYPAQDDGRPDLIPSAHARAGNLSASGQSPVQPALPVIDPIRAAAFRSGNGVSAPVVISKVEPDYSDQARSAHREGPVALDFVVDVDGKAKDIKVLRSLGLGLDEKAIEAVQKWRFKPGEKEGMAVPVMTTVEIRFRLF